MYAYMYVCLCVHAWMRVVIHAYVCVYVCVSEYTYMNGFVTCIYMYVCIILCVFLSVSLDGNLEPL